METIKIGDICSFENGDRGENYPSRKDYVDDGIPFVNSGNILNGKIEDIDLNYITEEKFNRLRAGKASRGDFVFTLRGSLGKNAVVEFDKCAIASMLVIMRPDESKIDKLFFRYAMNSPWLEKQVQNIDNGSIQGNLGVSNVKDFFIPYPNMVEQKKIASILASLDEKISTNNMIIETSEKLMHEIYDYWFVQFDFPDENGHPYESSGGEMVYNEKLKREIPKGWSVKRVDELCEVKTGKEDANFSVPDGDYKFFTCADEPLRCNTPCFSGKSILIAGNGNFNVKHYDGNFNAYQRTYVLQPGDEFYGITFIEAKNKTELFTKGSNGSIVKFITKGDVGGISVLTSPRAMELYETFNTILAEIDAVQSENEKLASLRDWLLPMLMNGQIKVND